MEGQRHNNPLNPRCFCLQRPKTDGTVLAPNPHYSGGRALGDSFKLVMLALRTVREMTQLPKETQKNGDTNKSKGTNEHAMHKPRLNTHKNTLGPTGLYELVLVAVHMENFQCTA